MAVVCALLGAGLLPDPPFPLLFGLVDDVGRTPLLMVVEASMPLLIVAELREVLDSEMECELERPFVLVALAPLRFVDEPEPEPGVCVVLTSVVAVGRVEGGVYEGRKVPAPLSHPLLTHWNIDKAAEAGPNLLYPKLNYI
jgi:hypothetical protein